MRSGPALGVIGVLLCSLSAAADVAPAPASVVARELAGGIPCAASRTQTVTLRIVDKAVQIEPKELTSRTGDCVVWRISSAAGAERATIAGIEITSGGTRMTTCRNASSECVVVVALDRGSYRVTTSVKQGTRAIGVGTLGWVINPCAISPPMCEPPGLLDNLYTPPPRVLPQPPTH